MSHRHARQPSRPGTPHNLANKDATWDALIEGTEDDHWRWGWNNFFVRDDPTGPYSPEVTLDQSPVPVYITYQ